MRWFSLYLCIMSPLIVVIGNRGQGWQNECLRHNRHPIAHQGRCCHQEGWWILACAELFWITEYLFRVLRDSWRLSGRTAAQEQRTMFETSATHSNSYIQSFFSYSRSFSSPTTQRFSSASQPKKLEYSTSNFPTIGANSSGFKRQMHRKTRICTRKWTISSIADLVCDDEVPIPFVFVPLVALLYLTASLA